MEVRGTAQARQRAFAGHHSNVSVGTSASSTEPSVAWRYVPATDTEEGFYSFAAITRDPAAEMLNAGHDRCVIALKPEHIDPWSEPAPGHLSAMYAILDDPADAYYQQAVPVNIGNK